MPYISFSNSNNQGIILRCLCRFLSSQLVEGPVKLLMKVCTDKNNIVYVIPQVYIMFFAYRVMFIGIFRINIIWTKNYVRTVFFIFTNRMNHIAGSMLDV